MQHRLIEKLRLAFLSRYYGSDLNQLARLYGSDKCGGHHYTQHYELLMKSRRKERLTVLEIGIGGYSDHLRGGESLRMWKAYFPYSQIVGIDLFPKSGLAEKRIHIRQLDQTDVEGIVSLSEEFGGFDIVIDDGSHVNNHVILTFRTLFPLLKTNGLYIIEDTQTSYWPTYGGGLHSDGTIMAYFKNSIDGLNYREIPDPNYVVSNFCRARPKVTPDDAPRHSEFCESIVQIIASHNLLIIRKGDNSEQSNLPLWVDLESLRMQLVGQGEDRST